MNIRSGSLTIAQQIESVKGQTIGFDYLRIFLSLAVLLWHCISLSDFAASVRIFTGPWRFLPLIILPAFFALSGFLVAGSLGRTTLYQFATLRVIRIAPALAFETVLSAVLLGALFTTLPLHQYFTAREFFAYFLNIIGNIHYTLPGVFNGKVLNAQLWTIPAEFECYMLLMLAAALGLVRRRDWFGMLVVAGAVLLTVVATAAMPVDPTKPLPGRVLVFSFLAGVALYLCRDRIRHSYALLALSMLASVVLLSYAPLSYLAALPVAYLTVWIGVTRPPRIPFGDLSYGVYLFHFPVARTLWECLGSRLSWWSLALLTLAVTTVFAAVSWWGIEQPVLRRKKAILARVDQWWENPALRLRALRGIKR